MLMTERDVGSVTILDLAGTIMIEADATRLKDGINSLIVQERTSVILNLAEVSYMDSVGLGQLAASHEVLKNAGGSLKLMNVSRRNHNLLSITGLATIFQAFDTEEAALQSFETPPTLPTRLVAQ
jgi:anti-sigma B factor antagonist